MKSVKLVRTFLALFILLAVASCAPKVTFHVTRPPELPVKDIETISMGSFKDAFKQKIPLPSTKGIKKQKKGRTLKPKISRFSPNNRAADLVRAIVVAGLSKSGQYRILKTGTKDGVFTGVIPDASKTGIINARVKYCELTNEKSEKLRYLLMATKGTTDFREQAILLATREAVIMAAESAKKGFEVPTPYTEKVAAMEVEFDLVRKSTGKKLIPTQRFKSYFRGKWGGDQETSHLSSAIKEVILTRYQKEESFLNSLMNEAAKMEMSLLDPDEFLARGGNLKTDPSIPKNSLEIQTDLARQIVDIFLKKISRYTVETTLKVASGDSIAVNFINANAYELAINRLENLKRDEDDSFNLALAYESIAEYQQASKYYKEALNQDPGNSTYKEAIKRVQ